MNRQIEWLVAFAAAWTTVLVALAHLQPVTWNEVTTKTDLDTLGTNLGAELRADFVEAMNRQIEWLVAFAAAWTTVLVALVRLIP